VREKCAQLAGNDLLSAARRFGMTLTLSMIRYCGGDTGKLSRRGILFQIKHPLRLSCTMERAISIQIWDL
jgi:hypothetical protein